MKFKTRFAGDFLNIEDDNEEGKDNDNSTIHNDNEEQIAHKIEKLNSYISEQVVPEVVTPLTAADPIYKRPS